MDEWKNNFGILIGDGIDHQKPFLRFALENTLHLFTLIKNIASMIRLTEPLVHFMDSNGPWKHETGATEISGLRLKEKTAEAIKGNAFWISAISKERIRDELMKIIMSERAAEGVELLRKLRLLKHIVPEIEEGYGVAQTNITSIIKSRLSRLLREPYCTLTTVQIICTERLQPHILR
jgi:hypothetical protein